MMATLKSKLDYLFVGAHPDDCEIMAGGTILSLVKQKRKVGILDLTQGELGTNGSMALRKKEAARATKIAGVDYRKTLNIKDGTVSSNRENEIEVVKVIRRTRPDIIFTFKPQNRHPDHEATHYLVKRAVFLSGLKRYHAPTSKMNFRPSALVYFGEPYFFQDRPDFLIDVSPYYEKKIEMICCYSSQVKVNWSAPPSQTLLGSDLFWNALKGKEGWYGSLIGCQYAEGFWSDQRLRIQDPLIHFKREVS